MHLGIKTENLTTWVWIPSQFLSLLLILKYCIKKKTLTSEFNSAGL